MPQPTRRLWLTSLLVLLSGTLLGGAWGVRADSARPEEQLWTFGRVLSLVEDQYVGEADSEEMVQNAISGLLQTLDPHSSYLNAESFNEMRDEQRGKFSGLGIQITKRGADKPLTIITPIDDTPAYRAGLQSGDTISHINGEPTIDLTVHDAVRLLKGVKGTEVTITIQRPGLKDPFDVTLERDDIPIESIRVAYMLTEDVGFVRISNFTSTTADELDEAIAALTAQGMTRLLLDLRGNPGGLLDQAVQVSERFLPAGKMVVYTRGRIPGSNQDYFAKRGVDRLDLPLVVLVDRSSASASEIVSGAMQDHDRGLVVGETSFGKGLVQRVIPLRGGGALAVTTAKYYTPAGRLIQRDYSNLEEYYLRRGDEPGDDALETPPSGAELEFETPETEIFYTPSGREVYGGGGITPDYTVEPSVAKPILLRLLRQNLIFDYAVRYIAANEELSKDLVISDETVADFRAFLDEKEFEYEAADFEEAQSTIVLRMRSQIARVKWDQETESRVLSDADPQVQKALELFDEAEELRRQSEDNDGEPGKKPLGLRAEVEPNVTQPEIESP